MKRWTLLLALALIPATGVAEEAAKRESVERLLLLTNADSIIDSVYAQMGQMMQGMAQQMEIQPSERELFDRHTARLVEVMREEMSWERLKDPMTDVYLKHYTEREILDMIAFYESETGRSMIDKMPAVMADSMAISQAMVQGFLPRIQEISAELESELAARRSTEE